MQYVIDLAIAAIVVFNLIRGRRRGLVKTVFGLVSVTAAIIIAYIFGGNAGVMLRKTALYENITDGAEKKITDYMEKSFTEDSDDAYDNIADSSFVKRLEALGVDAKKELEGYTVSFEEGARNTAREISKKLVNPVLEAVSNVVGTILVFAGAIVVFWILSKLLTSLFRLPFLNSVNKAGGTILGAILGLIYAFVFCTVIKLIIPYVPQNPIIYSGMENETLLYGFFAAVNPLHLLFIGKLFSQK